MKLVLVFAIGLLVTGCAGGRSLVDAPIIDRKGVDMNQYYADKADLSLIHISEPTRPY